MRVAIFLLISCLSLGAFVAYQLASEPGNQMVAGTEKSRAPPVARASIGPIQLPKRDVYDEVVAKNLFDPSRQPPAETEPAQLDPRARHAPESPSFRLKGIVITPQGRKALIELSRTQVYRSVTEGEAIDGWLIEEIATDRISVHKAGTATVVELKAAASNARPPVRRRDKSPVTRRRRN